MYLLMWICEYLLAFLTQSPVDFHDTRPIITTFQPLTPDCLSPTNTVFVGLIIFIGLFNFLTIISYSL